MEFEDFKLLREAREALDKEQKGNKYPAETLVCECMCISVDDIRCFLKSKNLENKEIDLETLRQELKLGSGCSSCTKSFNDWKTKI